MELIEYNADKYEKIESEFYTFFFDKALGNAIKTLLPNEADKRRDIFIKNLKMASTIPERPKALYFVRLTDNIENGRAFSNIIKCCIHNDNLGLLPMAHEEAHLVTYSVCGSLPVFWSEGLAEYSTAMLLNYETVFSQNYIRDIMRRLNVSTVTELILSSDKKSFYHSIQNSNFCLALAGCFIFYLINCCDSDVFKKIINSIKMKDFENVYGYFESNAIVAKWLEWYGCNYGL